MSNGVDRATLRFAEKVKIQFAFLESLGFRCIETNATLVRFESPRILLNVFHGRKSYEIDIDFRAKRKRSDSYWLTNLLDLLGDTDCERGPYATHTVKGVKTGVQKLAQTFRRCIDSGVLDDPKLFTRLKAQSEKSIEEYVLEVALTHARNTVAIAWAKKDFSGVVRAFKPLQTHLTSTEAAKLAYATKQIKASH